MVPRSPPIESRHNRRRSFRAGSPCEWRRDPPARRRAGRGRAPGFRPRPQAARTSTLLREKQMLHFLAEFAPGASKHLLGSLSFGWSPVADGRQQIGRAALPRYFSLGKTVAIVGRRTNTRRKQGDGAATETRKCRANCRRLTSLCEINDLLAVGAVCSEPLSRGIRLLLNEKFK